MGLVIHDEKSIAKQSLVNSRDNAQNRLFPVLFEIEYEPLTFNTENES